LSSSSSSPASSTPASSNTGAEEPSLADIEGFLARHEQKELLRFTTVGSVDDGKSTLIGRLLHDTGSVYDDQIRAVQRATKGRGLDEDIDFSLFTDGLLAEREQGITIDVAYRYFTTPTRKFIIADTPGHVEYTRNMATGASTADVAILLLDARLGVLPQSRRHAAVASLLAIARVVVAVNKMDLVGYDEAVFDRLRQEFGAFLEPLGFADVHFVPVSAKAGDNVVHRGTKTPWYGGQTLLELLETLPPSRPDLTAPFRFPVQTVIRPNLDYRGFAGWVASGTVRIGDRVVVLPSMRETTIVGIDTADGALDVAGAPLSVALRLADEVDVSRGEMIAPASAPPAVSAHVEANLVWLSGAFDPTRKLLMKHTSRWVPATVAEVVGKLSLETLELQPDAELRMNDLARVRLALSRPIFCDPYRESRQTGAFILVDALSNQTVAAGMIVSALGEWRSKASEPVNARERALLLGHRAALVCVAGEAVRLERSLYEHGILALAVPAEEVTTPMVSRLLSAGLVVLVTAVDDDVLRGLRAAFDALPFLDLRHDAEDPVKRVRDWVGGADAQVAGSGI
jgi:bifunctional enzyme CysN/CysC/sulfate adenylyltransferase subunit 1